MLEVKKYNKSIIAESFRRLKTNIQYSSLDKEYRVISITSSKFGEGKTFVAANLAFTMSEGNKKVVLIDCNFRNPSIHKKFNISNTTGLSEILFNKENLNMATRIYNKNFEVITSGHNIANPSEALSSERMSELLEELKEKYDYIILDTPPILYVSDSQVLSSKADGTIVVVRSKKTKKHEIQEAYKILKNSNVKIIGTILNGVNNGFEKYFLKENIK